MSKAIQFRNRNNEKVYPCPYFPVGFIYLSTTSIDPSTYFGGTWEQIKDRFLLSCGSTYSAGSTGGAKSVSYTPKGTNAGTALTVAQMPKHRHSLDMNDDTVASGSSYARPRNSGATGTVGYQTSYSGEGATHTHTFTGTVATINTMPPYLAVYVWKRVS